MKKIIIRKEDACTIYLDALNKGLPVFAKKAGKLVGMVLLEYAPSAVIPRGWILRIGEGLGAYKHSETLEECILTGMACGYEFFVED